MEDTKTTRGFNLTEWEDFYGAKCSLQESSLAETTCIWLGIDNPTVQRLASEVIPGGTGWVAVDIPETAMISSRMHLTQGMVKALLPYLQRFAESGVL
jgi:hypothetical protein